MKKLGEGICWLVILASALVVVYYIWRWALLHFGMPQP